MITRRILLYTPILLIMLLLQSYFWVPTYEQQTRGNPERFGEYFTASIGDATLLNPILSADASSSEIEAKVFEGLIDYDENLRFRGRLATAWKVYEEAFFYVNETADIPGLDHPTPAQIADFLESARLRENIYPPQLQRTLNNISEISLIPPRKRVEYKYEGFFATYIQMLSTEEFDALTPDALVGMIDPDGQLSTELAYGQGLIAVVEQVLEYQKLDTRFFARVSIKFVEQLF